MQKYSFLKGLSAPTWLGSFASLGRHRRQHQQRHHGHPCPQLLSIHSEKTDRSLKTPTRPPSLPRRPILAGSPEICHILLFWWNETNERRPGEKVLRTPGRRRNGLERLHLSSPVGSTEPDSNINIMTVCRYAVSHHCTRCQSGRKLVPGR